MNNLKVTIGLKRKSNYPAKQRITQPPASYGANPGKETGNCQSRDSILSIDLFVP